MNEEMFFKTAEVPATPEEELAGELALEGARLEANLDGLNNDIEVLGGQENLEIALKENPNIAAKIAGKMALIMPILVTINTVFSGSFSESIRSGNMADLATLLVQFTAVSGVIAASIEAAKFLGKKEDAE